METTRPFARLVVLAVVLSGTVTAAQPGSGRTWTWVNPRPDARVLEAVSTGPGGLVAVGDSGTVLHSPDGISWSAVPSGTTSFLRDVVWTGSAFVAVGDAGTVVRSANGTDWEVLDTGLAADLIFVAWGNGLLVAGGPFRTLLTSTDGAEWQELTVGYSRFTDAVWTGSSFVAVGPSAAAVSPDGISWTPSSSYFCSMDDPHVATDGSRLVAVDYSGTVCRSEDGLEWSGDYWEVFASDVVWTGSLWVASDAYGVDLSPDGRAWTHLTKPTGETTAWTGLAWTGERVVAVGAPSLVALSHGGADWTVVQQSTNAAAHFHDVASGAGRVVAASFVGPMGVSSEGFSWELIAGVDASLRGLTYGGGRFVGVGHLGRVAVSADGLQWSVHSTNVGHLYDVAWDGTSFVAVARSTGSVISSPDGEHWTVETAAGDVNLRCVAAGDGLVVAGGDCCERGGGCWTPVVIVGNPGGPWEVRQVDQPFVCSGFVNLVWTGSWWLGSTFDGPVLASADLDTWVVARPDEGPTLNGMAWNGEEVLAVGSDGVMLSSRDGFDWVRETAAVGVSLYAPAWHDGAWIAVGGYGTALRGSTEAPPYAPEAGFSPPPPPLEPEAPLRFTDASRGQVTSWQWDFGDGGTSTTSSPAHAYRAEGTYSVVQTVCNDVACDTAEAQVTVEAGAPLAALSWSGLGFEAGREMHWLDLSTGPPTSWRWSFGDGRTSQERHPAHTYAEPGFYSVHLAATNAHGRDACSARALVGPPFQVPLEGLPPHTGLSGIASNGRELVAVGTDGLVVASRDGRHWAVTSVGDAGNFADVAWNGRWFVAVGSPSAASRSIAISRDGTDWELVVNQVGTRIDRVAGNSSCTIALGSGWAFRSADLHTWSLATIGSCTSPTDIAASPDLLVVACSEPAGSLFESSNGVTWTGANGDFGGSVSAVSWTTLGLLARSDGGVMRRDDDGTWVRVDAGSLNLDPPPLDHLEAVAGVVLGGRQRSDSFHGGVHWLSANNVWVRQPDWPSSAMAVAWNTLWLVGGGDLYWLPIHPDPLPRRVAGRVP